MLLALLLACHENRPATLAGIDDGHVSLWMAEDGHGGTKSLAMELSSETGGCVTLSELEGTANGEPLTLIEPGYMERQAFLLGQCHYTRIVLEDATGLDPADGLEIELTDGTATWTLVGEDLLAPRGYALVEPSGAVGPGDAVTLSWAPQSGSLYAYPPEVLDHGQPVAVEDAAAEGWDISFTLPDRLDADTLTVVPAAYWRPELEVCDGPVYCVAGEYTPGDVRIPVE